MNDLAAASQALLSSLARKGEGALAWALGADSSPPRRRIGLESSADGGGGDAFAQTSPSPDVDKERGRGRHRRPSPPPHLYQRQHERHPGRPTSSEGGDATGSGSRAASSAGASPSSAPSPSSSPHQRREQPQPWHRRARSVARAHASALREVAAMRFAYVDEEARWRDDGGGDGEEGRRRDDRGDGEESRRRNDRGEDDGRGRHRNNVAVVVVVAAHLKPRSVTRREALLHSLLVADEFLGGGESDDDESDGEKSDRSPPRDFVVVLYGASATVPALSYDAQFFAELHAALPPTLSRRMRAFYVVHAGWGLRAWLAALRLAEPAVYGRVEFVSSLRDLERRFFADGGESGARIPRPPDHVVAADEKRVARAAAAGQVL